MKFNTKKIQIALLLLFVVGVLSAQKKQHSFELAGQQIQLHGEFGAFEEEIVIDKISEGLAIATISIKHKQGATKDNKKTRL